MKKINIKMFGKNSVSTLLYWISWVFLIFWTGFYLDAILSISGYILQNNLATTILTLAAKFVFFYLLILIFKEFKSNKMFTTKIIRYLNIFAVINLCMPLIVGVFYLIIYEEIFLKRSFEEGYPYLIIAIFSFFLAAIFKQGFQIQQENDLTI